MINIITQEPNNGKIENNKFYSINEILKIYNSEDEHLLPSDEAEVPFFSIDDTTIRFDRFVDIINFLRVEKNKYVNSTDWIPVSTGVYPDDNESVQITFKAFGTKDVFLCDQFAYYKRGDWYYAYTTDKADIEIIAWKKNCNPYTPKF